MICNRNSRSKIYVDRYDGVAKIFAMLMVIAILIMGGCDSSDFDRPLRVAIEGTVLVDHQPLQQGMLWFIPLDGVMGPKASAVIKDGRFVTTKQTGPVPGMHRIEIRVEDASEPAFDDEQTLVKLSKQRIKKLGKPVRLPLKYNEQSTLVATIQSTADGQPLTLNYQLQSR